MRIGNCGKLANQKLRQDSAYDTRGIVLDWNIINKYITASAGCMFITHGLFPVRK